MSVNIKEDHRQHGAAYERNLAREHTWCGRMRELAKTLRKMLVLKGWSAKGGIGQSFSGSCYFVVCQGGKRIGVRVSDHPRPRTFQGGEFCWIDVSALSRYPGRELMRKLEGML